MNISQTATSATAAQKCSRGVFFSPRRQLEFTLHDEPLQPAMIERATSCN